MANSNAWKVIIDRFESRLNSWKAPLLFIGDRSLLINSVLGALGIFIMSLFHVPVGVMKKLEQLRSNIFCGRSKDKRKMHWASWKLILASKDIGGLGVGSLEGFNNALLQKWRWRFVNEPNAIWVKVRVSLYSMEACVLSFLKGNHVWVSMQKGFKKLNDCLSSLI
ncbi:putative mitochondrial protein AtMg00310 [Bidens hawaiensis]|uniref:putative mitochondrial protein AtMg00310 n=1 Tax=Bidens hawaiensis TaxID=980011 RepID=UPI00404AFCDE